MNGGGIMNQVKNILHKYLCPDALVVCELNEKAGDFVWLEKKGYYNRKTGEETKAGKIYTKQHDKMLTEHFEKIKDKSLEAKNMSELRKEIQKHIKNNPEADIYKDLTETEAFALRYVNHGHW